MIFCPEFIRVAQSNPSFPSDGGGDSFDTSLFDLSGKKKERVKERQSRLRMEERSDKAMVLFHKRFPVGILDHVHPLEFSSLVCFLVPSTHIIKKERERRKGDSLVSQKSNVALEGALRR